MDNNGVPVIYNEGWSKIHKGEVSLSPYATWDVQLVPRLTDPLDNVQGSVASVPFKEGTIWMEVNGHGTFVTQGSISASALDKYYGSYVMD